MKPLKLHFECEKSNFSTEIYYIKQEENLKIKYEEVLKLLKEELLLKIENERELLKWKTIFR